MSRPPRTVLSCPNCESWQIDYDMAISMSPPLWEGLQHELAEHHEACGGVLGWSRKDVEE